KMVVASGVTAREKRKNLSIVKSGELVQAVKRSLLKRPEDLIPEDYRFWEGNEGIIREVYQSL
ncbi:MAG: glycosyl transferase family 1, partial [Methanothrix sp.]